MKQGSVSKSDAVVLNGQGAVCGLLDGPTPSGTFLSWFSFLKILKNYNEIYF
jgi:hypothetical protein